MAFIESCAHSFTASTYDSLPSMCSDGSSEYMEEILAVCVDIPDSSTRRAIELILLLVQDVRTSLGLKIEDVKVSTAKRISFGIESAINQSAQGSLVEKASQMSAPKHPPLVGKPTAQKVAKPGPRNWFPISSQKSMPFITPSVRAAEPHSWCPIPSQKSVPIITLSARAKVEPSTGSLTREKSTSGESTSASASEPVVASPRPLVLQSASLSPNSHTSSIGISQNVSEVANSSLVDGDVKEGVGGVDATKPSAELPLWLQITSSMATKNL